ncbi:NAD(P)H-binding protein [Kribbella sp. NPDC006257]|uniref:NAD(P)-dependent oxidoreductase n=1 Tax=Kribbella sp. NPDC006257 TaxID=3156738 RepID=UPI0033B02162
MNVTVFGATGGVGSLVVGQLRTRGHMVTAYVRNPDKVPAGWGDAVNVVVGELSDAAAIDHAVQGADAVISALGPSLDRKATGLPLIKGTRNILTAMQHHGVRRYVGNATPSILDPREKPTWQTRLPTFMAKTFLRRAHDELVAMSQIVMTSGLDWTIVRFLAPKNGPARGQLRHGFYGHDKLGFNVTRADIAAFTAAQVDDNRYIGAAPGISN